jgi:hypothetical protein
MLNKPEEKVKMYLKNEDEFQMMDEFVYFTIC